MFKTIKRNQGRSIHKINTYLLQNKCLINNTEDLHKSLELHAM